MHYGVLSFWVCTRGHDTITGDSNATTAYVYIQEFLGTCKRWLEYSDIIM